MNRWPNGLLNPRTEVALTFTEKESRYLCLGGLGRLATTGPDGTPHVVPVAYEFDGHYLYFSGRNLERSLKFRNLMRNSKVALVVDDVVSVSPWRVRGLVVRGVAELLSERGRPYVRILPRSKASWGL